MTAREGLAMARRSRSEEAALELLGKYAVVEAPVDVERIALHEGAEVVRGPAKGNEAGFALRDGGRKIIGVNVRNHALRQRFTIAHELGHLVLHPGKPLIMDPAVRVNKRNETSSLGTDFEEIQANSFAATLLMPRHLLSSAVAVEAESVRSQGELVERLAKAFEVSQDAMMYRLMNLGIISG